MSARDRSSTEPNGREPTLPGGGRPSAGRLTDGIQVVVRARTDVGLVREHNEDNFLVADLSTGDHASAGVDAAYEAPLGEHGFLLAVCDGMGGAAAGEVASQMAVDAILETMLDGGSAADRDGFARRLVSAVEEAGNRIYSAAKMDRSRRGMGTTATVAGLRDKVLFVGQVGDSRAYVQRAGRLVQITKDQSLVNQLVEAGQLTEEEAEGFEHSNIILQALGTTEEVQVDLTFLELRRGDVLLLCSDGLSGLVHAEHIREVLETHPDLASACTKLVDMANQGGGHDNVTVLCARFDGAALPPPEDPAILQPAYQQYPLPPGGAEASELPPARRTTIKVSGPKPGADVKRPRAAVDSDDDGAPSVPVRAFPWWWVAIGVLLLAVVAVLALAAGGRGQSPSTAVAEASAVVAPRPESPPVELRQENEPVTVVVHTDIGDAVLYVDGEKHERLEDGMALRLPPGRHRLSARLGGSAIAEADISVAPGRPSAVELRLPLGLGRREPGAAPTALDDPAQDDPARDGPPQGDPAPRGSALRDATSGDPELGDRAARVAPIEDPESGDE